MPFFFRLCTKRFRAVLLTIFAGILSTGITLVWNQQLSFLINMATSKNLHSTLSQKHVLLLLLMIFLCAAFQGMFTYLAGFSCEGIMHDLRMDVARFYLHQDQQSLHHTSIGMLSSIFQNELEEIHTYMTGTVFTLLNDLIKMCGTILWFFMLCKPLTLLILIPDLCILSYVVFASKIIERYAEHTQNAKAYMHHFVGLLVTLFPVLTVYDAFFFFQKKFAGSLEKWTANSMHEERIRAKLMSLSALLSTLPLMLTLFFGGHFVLSEKITLGTLYVFINLSGNVFGVLMNMPQYLAGYRRFIMNLNRMDKRLTAHKGGTTHEHRYE